MRIPQNKYQSSFSQERLLDRMKFSEFCRKQGLNVFVSDLPLLWERRLFFPAIRLIGGINCMRKIKSEKKKYYYAEDVEKKTELEKEVEEGKYYKPALVVRGGSDWLKFYEKNKLYSFPSQEKEVQKPKYGSGMFSSPEEVPQNSEVFYDRYQFIALKLIFHDLKVFSSASKKLKQNIEKASRKRVAEFYKFLPFYSRILDLQKECEDDSEKEYKQLLSEYGKNKDSAGKDLAAYKKGKQQKKFQKKALKLLQAENYEVKDIEKWLRVISAQSFLRALPYPFEFVKDYIKMIPNEILMKEYTNEFLMPILWFRNILIGNDIPLQDYLYSQFDFSSCYICGTRVPTNRKTCGKDICKKEYNKYYKKSQRNVNPDYGQ